MLDRELTVTIEAARAASAAILGVWNADDFDVRQKEDNKGPLTEADLAANAILLDAIRTHFPEDGVLSEEEADNLVRLERRRCWVVDPLDGTREFTLRMPEFCVSVGLVEDGQPILGVLLNPATGQLITGVKGRGVQLDGADVRPTDHDTLAGARLLVSRSEFEKGWFDAYKDTARLQPMGSVAWKLGLVAAGLAEATFTPKPRNEWDLCAGAACLVAGGGLATDGQRVPYRFNQADPLKIGVCGTNGPLHDTIMGLMKRG